MTDDQQQQPLPTEDDPLTSLESLLQAAKAKRHQTGEQGQPPMETTPEAPAGPSPEELEAQRQAELAAREETAEATRLQELEAHQQKMATELQNTPEFQARQEQNAQAEAEHEAKQAEQEGHVIRQLEDDKI